MMDLHNLWVDGEDYTLASVVSRDDGYTRIVVSTHSDGGDSHEVINLPPVVWDWLIANVSPASKSEPHPNRFEMLVAIELVINLFEASDSVIVGLDEVIQMLKFIRGDTPPVTNE
jgi:hypothetical protein